MGWPFATKTAHLQLTPFRSTFAVLTMNITDEKKGLRKSMLTRRRELAQVPKQAYDAWVCRELEELISQRQVKVLHAYIPLPGEIDIEPLLRTMLAAGVKVVSPKTLPKRRLENRILSSLEELEVGIMGTRHPAAAVVYDGPIDFVIVPGLAYDAARYRLGYGGGYYDTFLAAHPAAFRAGIFYPFQEVEAVPREAHDEQLHAIVSRPLDTFA